MGINDRGDIAGGYDDGKGDHGFMRDRRGRITTIDVPGARGTAAQKINNRGQIAGVYSDTSPDTQVPPERGFLLERGKLTRIDVPDAVQTRAVGINNRGQVVGEYTDADGMVHGFLWDKGQFTTIDVPEAAMTSAVDINDRGQIVGVHTDGRNHDPGLSAERRCLHRIRSPRCLIHPPLRHQQPRSDRGHNDQRSHWS